MSIYLYIFVFLFFSGLVVYSSKRKHLLLMLLSLEFVVLSLYFLIFIFERNILYEFFFSIIFLTFRVCEGSLGLAILVSIIRTCGNDYIIRYSVL